MLCSRNGIPDVVKTDNGPPFNGNEFQTFSKDFGFRHRKITPLWQEANREAEWFMATLIKHVRAATGENYYSKNQIPQFLRHYRATPHRSTHVSPFETLTGRKMRVSLPKRPLPHSDPSWSASGITVCNIWEWEKDEYIIAVDWESLYDFRMGKECVQSIAVDSEPPVRFGNGKECVHNIAVDLELAVSFQNGEKVREQHRCQFSHL